MTSPVQAARRAKKKKEAPSANRWEHWLACVESKRVDAFAEMSDAELDAYLQGKASSVEQH